MTGTRVLWRTQGESAVGGAEPAAPRADPDPDPRSLAGDEAPRRVGLLGGTFDPPHFGHLVLGMLAADALELDRVLFIPAGVPPNKRDRPISSATDRLLMTRLAIAGDPLFELSALEVERPGISYTVDTVAEYLRLYPEPARLFLIMAADSLATIDAWREPERLLAMVEWVIGPRPGSAPPDRAALRARFGDLERRLHLVDGPALDISSSAIRTRVAAGRPIRYLVPPAVEEQIAQRRLYR